MLKNLGSLILCTAFFINAAEEKTSMSRNIIIVSSGIGAATLAVLYAPVIVPYCSIVTIKMSLAAVGTKASIAGAGIKTSAAVFAPIAATLKTSIAGVRWIRPYIIQNNEEKIESLLQKEAYELASASYKFENCIKKHNFYPNLLCIPNACKDEALKLALIGGEKEFLKLLKDVRSD